MKFDNQFGNRLEDWGIAFCVPLARLDLLYPILQPSNLPVIYRF